MRPSLSAVAIVAYIILIGWIKIFPDAGVISCRAVATTDHLYLAGRR